MLYVYISHVPCFYPLLQAGRGSTAGRRRFHRLGSQPLAEKYKATKRILGAGVSGAVLLGVGRDGQEAGQVECTNVLRISLFPECVAKGSCFCLGGLGAGPCSFRFRDCGHERSRTTASVRERPRATVLCPMRCALRIGLEGGRLGEALWRCAVVIAGESLVWVALCRCDCWESLVWVALCRCDCWESLVWVALCRCDCWGEPGLGGAVPL